MLGAASLAAIFLVGFVYRFVRFGPTPFTGTGPLRAVFAALYFTHEPLAVVNVIVVIVALGFALTGRFREHREAARIAAPVWLYVCASGLALYFLLYLR